MNVFDIVYVAIAVAFFVACDRVLSAIDERGTDGRR